MNKYTQDTYHSDIEQLDMADGSIWRRTKNLKTKRFDISQMKNPLNNHPAHTEKDKAEVIANHFETQFKLNNFGIASTEITVSNSIEKFNTSSPTSNFGKVRASEIADYLKKIKIKKAPGIDNITNKMLKYLPLKIILKLTNLYNDMLHLNHFPGCWKTARVLPILKPGKDPTQPISYRPISPCDAQ
ncbi:RNA-directed DNA polymerase from mobile element jockey [Araneus ventricosus]|uniref:RNA-directed DNA polymerase from mobile element jockey n=1 Tax=Araneus ventricosus TaxID=182803 RepID=A0A4Y2L6N4_ARAVE|nr:RNA-directed DNA polymerase from mobile element jockey [Araneus ventricosus]